MVLSISIRAVGRLDQRLAIKNRDRSTVCLYDASPLEQLHSEGDARSADPQHHRDEFVRNGERGAGSIADHQQPAGEPLVNSRTAIRKRRAGNLNGKRPGISQEDATRPWVGIDHFAESVFAGLECLPIDLHDGAVGVHVVAIDDVEADQPVGADQSQLNGKPVVDTLRRKPGIGFTPRFCPLAYERLRRMPHRT